MLERQASFLPLTSALSLSDSQECSVFFVGQRRQTDFLVTKAEYLLVESKKAKASHVNAVDWLSQKIVPILPFS